MSLRSFVQQTQDIERSKKGRNRLKEGRGRGGKREREGGDRVDTDKHVDNMDC